MESKHFVLMSIAWILIQLVICQNVTLKNSAVSSSNAFEKDITNTADETEYGIHILYSTVEVDNSTQFIEKVNITDDLGVDNSTGLPNTTLFPEENDTKPTEPEADKSIVTTTMISDIKLDEICMCDLLAGACDVNCCCDKDCTASDRRSFSECIPRPSPPDEQYCFKRNIIFINNTEYNIAETKSGLFCIVHDNFKERFYYQEKPPITNLEGFINIPIRDHFTWTVEEKLRAPSLEVKAGKPIFVLSNKDIQQISHWWLPFQTFTNLCESKKEIEYMINMESSCQQKWVNFEEDCQHKAVLNANVYYKDFYFLKLPLTETNLTEVNSTYDSSFGNNSDYNILSGQTTICERNSSCIAIIPVNNYICRDEFSIPKICRIGGEIPSPEYNASSKICKNVVTKVKYEIIHNGIHGIHEANVKFETTDVVKSLFPLIQTFTVKFHWLNSSNITFRRSGNPGYQIGHPIMAGKLRDKIPSQGIVLDSNRKRWFTITGSSVDGSCSEGDNDRITVKFSENIKSGCLLKISAIQHGNICAYIQEKIMKILLGNNFPTYVGVFGNSDVYNLGDWVEILHEGKPVKPYPQATSSDVCPSIVLHLHTEIAYASIGSLANPQRKIIGVVYKYATPQGVKLFCSGLYCHKNNYTLIMEITNAVSFIDVSEPAVAIYAKPPVIEAKLPDDIFYPFLSSAASKLTPASLKMMMHIMCITLSISQCIFIQLFFRDES